MPGHDAVTLIEPRGRRGAFGLVDTWRRRDLVFFLVLRDLKLRYRQTALGAMWAVLQPLVTMAIFTLIFSRVAGMSSDGFPYPLWSYAGLVPWVYFANSLNRATASVVGNVAMVDKVYFPRLVLPISAVLSGVVDFVIASVLLGVMLGWYGIVPGPAVVVAWPLGAAFAIVVSLGCGLWLAALNARYRDVQHVLPFVLQAWLFATPIAYPASALPLWTAVLGLNPMAGVVESLRWSLLSASASAGLVALSAAVALMVLVTGLVYFDRVQADFADFV